jgi:hypothetical protein
MSRRLGVECLEDRRLLAGLEELPTEGEIGTLGETQRYLFTVDGEKSGRLTAVMSAAEGSSLDSYLALWAVTPGDDSKDRLIAQNDDRTLLDRSAELRLHLPSGDYRLEASAAPGAARTAAIGAFDLLTDFEPAHTPFANLPLPGGVGSIISGHFNGDEWIDLVAASNDSSGVYFLAGLGDGSFVVAGEPYLVRDQAGNLTTGDFNGDKRLDFAVGGNVAREVTIFIGGGDGTFAANQPIDVQSEPEQLAAGDLNGDGCDDLAVPTQLNGAWVFFSQRTVLGCAPPNGAVWQQLSKDVNADDSDNLHDARSAGIADFNGDRRLDLAVALKPANAVMIWTQNEDGKLSKSPAIPTCGSGTTGLVVEDFNGDGRKDWAVVNDKSDDVAVALARPNGSFAGAGLSAEADCEEPSHVAIYPVGQDTEIVIARDFNNDWILDLATQNEDTFDLSILLGRGDGTFEAARSVGVGTKPDDLAAGDFDRDGNLDLAVATRGEFGVIFLFGRGNGSFFTTPRVSVGDDPQALAQGDFNLDGVPDVAVANGGSHDVSVLLGRGDGGFEPQRLYSVAVESPADAACQSRGADKGQVPVSLKVADVNNDGRLDLVTVNEQPETKEPEDGEEWARQSGTVSIFLGLGDGTFEFDQHIRVGVSPWSLIAEDLDRDGRIDLATANRKSNDVTVLFGSDNNCFGVSTVAVGGRFPQQVVVSDAAAPGPRLVGTVNRLSHDVSWWPVLTDAKGGRRFGAVTTADEFPGQFTFDPATMPGWVAGSVAVDASADTFERFRPRIMVTGHFNDDPNLDLVVADDWVHELSVFLGHGDGTFQPAIRFPTTSDPEFIAVGDLNADGHQDLVTANDGEGSVVVLLGRGDGTFGDERAYPVEAGPEDVVIADLTKDGVLDLAVANDNVGILSLLVGNVSEGKPTGTFQKAVRVKIGENVVRAFAGMAAGKFTAGSTTDLALFDRVDAQITILTPIGGGEFKSRSISLPGQAADRVDEQQTTEATEENTSGTSKEPIAKYLAAGRLDDDGRLDLVAADLAEDRVWIVWSPAGGSKPEVTSPIFSPNRSADSGDSSIRPLTIADFNGDGRDDIAIAEENWNSVSVLLANENRTLNRGTDIGITGLGPGAIVSGDFGGDLVNGRPAADLIVGNRDSFDLSVLLGDGDGGFSIRGNLTGRPEPRSAIELDLNGDGNLDRVSIDEPSNQLRVEINLGGGRFDSATTGSPRGVDPVVADLNLDGHSDVATVSARGELVVRLGRPLEPGTFESPLPISAGSPVLDVAGVATAGGWLLATADQVGDRVMIYRFDTAAGGARVQQIPVGRGPWRLASGDLDRDGRGDLVVMNRLSQNATVLMQRSSGRFDAVGEPIDIGSTSAELVLADLMGDAFVDLAIAHAAEGAIGIWEGKGNGTFGGELPVQAGNDDLYGVSDARLVSRLDTTHLTVGRFDDDLRLDLVATNSGTNSVAVIAGKPGGAPSRPHTTLEWKDSPQRVVVGRFDSDAVDDLAVLFPDRQEIAVRLGVASGGFSKTETWFAAGNAPWGLAAANVGGSGAIDLLVSNEFGDLLVLLGKGDGKFETYRRADAEVRLTVADLDGDGRDDRVLADKGADRFCVELAARPAQTACYGTNNEALAPGAVAVGDMNRDGHRDLIVPNRGGNGVLVYLGVGGGALAPLEHRYHTGANPAHVTVAEVSGDSIPDLVVANEGSNDVTVLKGVGTGKSWRLVNGPRLLAGQAPIHSLILDVIGHAGRPDGIMDLVVTNSRSDDLYILPGRSGGFFADDAASRSVLQTGDQPRETLWMDGNLLTINERSSDVTLFADLRRGRGLSLPTGRNRPIRGVIDHFDFDDVPDFGVAHEDGSFSIFLTRNDGLRRVGTFGSQSKFRLSDFTVVGQPGRFEFLGVGASGTELVTIATFGLPALPIESVSLLGEVVSRFLPLAVTSVVTALVSGAAFTGSFDIAFTFRDPTGALEALVATSSAVRGAPISLFESGSPWGDGDEDSLMRAAERVIDGLLAEPELVDNPPWVRGKRADKKALIHPPVRRDDGSVEPAPLRARPPRLRPPEPIEQRRGTPRTSNRLEGSQPAQASGDPAASSAAGAPPTSGRNVERPEFGLAGVDAAFAAGADAFLAPRRGPSKTERRFEGE